MNTTHTFEAPEGYYSRRFWGGMALNAVLLFWMVAGMPWFENRPWLVIFGGVCTAFFLPGTLLILKRLLEKKPVLTVSRDGIEMHSTSGPGGLIRWNEMSGLSQKFIWAHWMIRVNLLDPRNVIARAPLPWKPVMYINMWIFGSPVFIVIAEIRAPHRFIKAANGYVPYD